MMNTFSLYLTIYMTCTLFCSGDAQNHTIVCPVNNQKFLSTNRNLLPVANVRASSEDASFNPVENFVTADSQNNSPWCTAPGVVNPRDHFVEVTFTEPVVLTLLESSGFVNGYVNNFMIEYTSLDNQNDVHLYSVIESPQEFRVPNILLADVYFTLERPVVAQKFKFRINDAVLDQDNRICWEMLLYGCTLSNARRVPKQTQDQVSTQPVSMATTMIAPPVDTGSQSEAEPVGCLSTEHMETGRQISVLIIALPVALGTIVIMLVIVIVGIMICLCIARRRTVKQPDYEAVSVRILNNRTRKQSSTGSCNDTPKTPLSCHYDSPRFLSYDVPKIRSRPASSGGSNDMFSNTFEIKNPIYSLEKSTSAKLDSTDEGNDYEMIPDVLPGTDTGVIPPSLHRLFKDGSQDKPEPRTNDPPSVDPCVNLDYPIPPHTYSVVDKQKKANARANTDENKDNEMKASVRKYAESTNPMFNPKEDIDEATLKEMDIIL